MNASNYPPGVTGSEPQIAGDEAWEELNDWLVDTGLSPREIRLRVENYYINQRAAVPEQPLAEKLRERADTIEKNAAEKEHDGEANRANFFYGMAEGMRSTIYELDAQHDEGRVLLREAINQLDELDRYGFDEMTPHQYPGSPAQMTTGKLIDRIRKHLGGDSDE